MVHPQRIRSLNAAPRRPGPVVYWMSRDQRVHDNWALLHAQSLASGRRQPLAVVFCLAPEFLGAAWRQYAFMLKGLREVEETLRGRGIPFFLLQGEPVATVSRFLQEVRAGAAVCDFSPLRLVRGWRDGVAAQAKLAVLEVDAHNIVPGWTASAKAEWGAYTLRPKLHRLLPEFLEDFPPLAAQQTPWPDPPPAPDWDRLLAGLAVDRSIPEVNWLTPGEEAGRAKLEEFIARKLSRYHQDRNNPTLDGQSDLSPHLHFGQLAPQRAALEVSRRAPGGEARAAFLEELIVRRELADNFCLYNPHYDQFEGFPDWARRTLEEHRRDPREYLYHREEFEAGATHDPLWNAAQREMVVRGKMHGYLRMYWAKKILEWSASPEEALATAIYLNDRYELDGRDPNGYAGIAWSIGGVHDRAWPRRPVFGKIRTMTLAGLRRKFAVEAYIEKIAATCGLPRK
ncbi:MAG: deoxyribodipyrimidine photo-lyase [Deltaproteobacteria bacterium]|nr:deoxyribodipyrimidine photo-lyase [Deltaproteobacteria bacterium]